MIEAIINKVKDTEAIRGHLLYWILGISYVQLAVLLLIFPIGSYTKYSIIFSFIMIMTGVIVIVFSLKNKQALIAWNWLLVSGIIDILFGIFLIFYPFKNIITLPYMVAFWIIIRSCYALGYSLDLSRLGFEPWRWYRIFDILAITCSLAILCISLTGIIDAVHLVNFAFLCMGLALIMYSRDLGKLSYTEDYE